MKVIGLVTLSIPPPGMRLFDWLAGVFSVRFQSCRPGRWEGLDAVIFVGEEVADNHAVAGLGLPSLKMTGQIEEPIQQTTAQVQFSTSGMVPKIFQGRLLEQEELGLVQPLKLEEGDSVLATISGQPVWAVRQIGGCRTDSVGLSLPKFDEARSLFHYFEGFNFFRLLPLIDFLHRLTGQDQWSSPQLQACFMFDDPNLHSSGYGWLDYRKLAAHAGTHGYHVAMATIPLDTWYTNRKSAAIYKDHKDRLSLLFHGNDHVSNELARFGSEERSLRGLAKALRKIAKWERSYSIQVSRVMAPPHGACSKESLRAMACLGFEAATTAYGALCLSNLQKTWAKQIGLRVTDVIAGLPIIPRFRFKHGNRFALLAAYLNQPIIPFGHHQDVAGGFGVLEDLVHFINSLGRVRWTDMGGVCRSNYLVRREGPIFRVQSVRQSPSRADSRGHHRSDHRTALGGP